MKKIFFSFLSILWIALFSCGEANPRKIKSLISISDTIVRNKTTGEQASIDSLCKIKSDSLFKYAYDSIYQKRWEEMNVLLDSIKSQ